MADDRDSASPTSSYVLRPTRAMRIFGWTIAMVGVLFVLSSLSVSQSDESSLGGMTGAVVTTSIAGASFAGIGLITALARLSVIDGALRYRSWRTRTISIDTLTAVRVERYFSNGSGRIRLTLDRTDGKPLRIRSIAAYNTAASRARYDAEAERLHQALLEARTTSDQWRATRTST